MSAWFTRITASPADYTPVLDAYEHFEREYLIIVKELEVRGKLINDVSGRIPGLSEYVYAQWAEIKAILAYLRLRLETVTQKSRKYYIEAYDRKLAAPQVEHFAKSDKDVIILAELIITLELLLDRWEGVSRGVERLHHQLRLLGELRKGGIEDATI